MTFFTPFGKAKLRSWLPIAILAAGLSLAHAQPETNSILNSPGQVSYDSHVTATNVPSTNAAPVAPAVTLTGDTNAIPVAPASYAGPSSITFFRGRLVSIPSFSIMALVALASIGGFLLYLCGLTRAKNSGHTSMLLLVGVLFGLTGYWIAGFAVQTGGVGDAHAALMASLPSADQTALDHEIGPVLFGHHWGLMGSAGFFLVTDDATRPTVAAIFLAQAALLAIALAAALGAALERGKLLAMAFCSYLIGVLIYPFFANWVWGGGWLAETGREFGLGHGFVDVGGSCVVHQTAGVLALVLAIILGPRHGRFGRTKPSNPIPGHNVPFIVLGSIVLLIAWMAANSLAATSLSNGPADPFAPNGGALAAVDTLLAALGGIVTAFIQAAVQRSRPEPARLCRGMLGGAVASCGGAGLLDPWAAFLVGCIAALLVQQAVVLLERRRIDDPVGASAVHGAAGFWGTIAVGIFANGGMGEGLNGVGNNVRGLLYGGAWHQLAAQFLGAMTGFVVVYLIGYAFVNLVQKILGNRVELSEEAGGLDQSEVGALGYQGDVEPEE